MDTVNWSGYLLQMKGLNVLFDVSKIKARSLPKILIPTTSGTEASGVMLPYSQTNRIRGKYPYGMTIFGRSSNHDPLLTLNCLRS